MSDFNSSLPVRTQSNGDVVAFLADGTTPSQLLAIDSSGRVTIKLDDGSGNAITSQVSGAQRALDVGINVSGVQIDPREIRLLTATDVVTSQQGTTPWVSKDQADGPVTPGTVASFSNLAGGQFNTTLPTLTNGQQAALQVSSSGLLLTSTTLSEDTNYGTVGTNTLRSAAQIGNATGAADFNSGATGAQTLRVAANQGAPNTLANGWPVEITDGTNKAAVKAASTTAAATDPSLVVALSPNSPVPAGTNLIGGATVYVGSSPNGPTNPVFVSLSDTVGTSIDSYQTSAALAAGSTANLDYTVTAAKTFYTKQLFASGSGKIKVVLSYETAPASGVFTTFFVGFNSTANPNILIPVPTAKTQVAGAKIRVSITNDDKAAFDVYETLSGTEQ